MAGETNSIPEVNGIRVTFVLVRWKPQGTSAPVLISSPGPKHVASVTRSDTGDFLVTLTGNYKQCLCAIPGVQHVTDVDLTAQCKAFNNLATSSAFTTTVTLLAGATPTDMAADDDSSVSLLLAFEDSDA